jgi:hypothetical protein
MQEETKMEHLNIRLSIQILKRTAMQYHLWRVISNPGIVSYGHNLIHMLPKQFYYVKGPNTSMHLII